MLGFKNLSYKSGFYDMIKQYQPKIDLEKLNREKQIWYREIDLVGHRYLPKAGANYVVKNQYPFSEMVEIHTDIEYLPLAKMQTRVPYCSPLLLRLPMSQQVF